MKVSQKIDLNSIDKTDWLTFRFDEIAEKISKTVKPEEADVDIYVGLEHIEAEDIHIRRKGIPADVKGGKLRCRPGDVIFGKRRAYQRKAAIVDFDGICSAHAFVFRAIEEVIDPQLFPFFLHSDEFMHRMIDISVGGLSPTINWGDLKHQEFLLPPKEQQAELAELLWAMDEVIEREKEVRIKIKYANKAYFNTTISKGINFREKSFKYKSILYPETWKPLHLKDLLKRMKNGISEPQNTKEQGIRVTRIETISDGIVNPLKVGFIKTEKNYDDYYLEVGDILFSHINSVSHIGKVALYTKNLYLFHGVNLMRLQCDRSLVRPKFLYQHLKNRPAKYYFERRAKQAVNQASLDKDDIGSLPLAIPELTIQDEIIKKIEQFEKSEIIISDMIDYSKSLRKSLINQIF